ncbi:SDR family NAD(P)-dependent oxidoreductase [Limnoglobus roseus]|uniref:NAD(P)-dependent oxidoreductase n=1 Tax=Limnoglobus roseus TaxID=2598579 RepID=A0A5C1AJS2_9BACT|nr:SDR family NAD(P)-dependent oxidoreductase [Limnoglobus roseus]QEL19110.1 NAD(P)-dependent oxidoreductase [Limnoglobus roseus]
MTEQFRLDGQVAVVTGGGQGIGEAVCRRLASAGAKVGVFDMSADNANRVAKDIGGVPMVGDLTKEADLDRVFGEVVKAAGPVSILVNNAGVASRKGRDVPIWESVREDWEYVMNINVTGLVLCCKAVLPGMIEKKYGRVINIASIAGKEGNPKMGPYSASKAAVICLTKSLSKELVGKGDICVNSVAPAVIQTPILDQLDPAQINMMLSKIPLGRTGKPDEVANLIHFLSSRECSFTTGFCFDISGGRATY